MTTLNMGSVMGSQAHCIEREGSGPQAETLGELRRDARQGAGGKRRRRADDLRRARVGQPMLRCSDAPPDRHRGIGSIEQRGGPQ